MAASIFGEPRQQALSSLVSIKAGKLSLSGTTMTADPRKGLMLIRKSDDGLMHFIWKDRMSSNVEDDLIIFSGDASLKHVTQCKDGFAMLLEFTTGRRLFFWSQEPRKNGLAWDDVSKEKDLLAKANDVLNGNTPAPAAAPAPLGFGGMTHSELMAMLSGGVATPAPTSTPAAAPAATPAAAALPTTARAEPSSPTSTGAAPTTETAAAPAPTPTTTEQSAPTASSVAPAPATPMASSMTATPSTTTSAAPPAAAGGFSASDISNILGNIMPPGQAPAPTPAAPPPATPAAGGFSAEAISSILSGLTPQTAPLTLNQVITPEATQPLVDQSLEQRLSEHLPTNPEIPETVTETLTTPQLQQAMARMTEALHTGDASGLIAELGIQPAGVGVEPFLRALQAGTPAAAPAEAMDTDETSTGEKPQPMEE